MKNISKRSLLENVHLRKCFSSLLYDRTYSSIGYSLWIKGKMEESMPAEPYSIYNILHIHFMKMRTGK